MFGCLLILSRAWLRYPNSGELVLSFRKDIVNTIVTGSS